MLQSLIAVCIGCRDNTIDVFNPVTYMLVKFSLALVCWVALMPAVIAAQPKSGGNETGLAATPAEPSPTAEPPLASSVDLKQVFESPFPLEAAELPHALQAEAALLKEAKSVANGGAEWGPIQFMLNANDILKEANTSRQLLGVEVPPATATRLAWKPSRTFSGMAVDTPVLVVNGAYDGPTMCLTAAVHGDELNGIEMVRRILYDLDPHKLHGMIIGIPIVNLLGFTRSSRYLPDRRDLNRYFPGNPNGSVASRIAAAFFADVVKHCTTLVDLHTGSFYRTNIPQLRADMNNPLVAEFVELFGDIPVLHSRGNRRSLRAAATRAGIPTVTLEAGEPMRLQRDMVEVGVKTINTLLAKSGMYSKLGLWVKPEPAFYDSAWVRANTSGILFSRMELGDEVNEDDVLGAVNNPITNEQIDILSPHHGRILGMALDQFVMPGYAVYHIGIHAAKETLMATEAPAEDDTSIDELDEFDDVEELEDIDERPARKALDADTYDDE